MDVLDAIRGRRAIRQFRPEPVSGAALRQLVEAACWAPSAMNGQPWRFVVVTDESLIAEISEQSKRWMLEKESGFPEADRLATLLREPGIHIFHHAPALVVIAAPKGARWGIEGCTLAAENLMLAATSLDLGTCWVGLAEGWLNTEAGRAALQLPKDAQVVASIAVGHPQAVPGPVERRQPAVTWLASEGHFAEDGEAPDYTPHAGLYGSLIHP